MNLLGDAVLNFIDGLIIATSFMTNTVLGVTTTLAVALHEIPQEMGDFGVLVYGGVRKKKALFLNFLAALTVILGGIIGYAVSSLVEPFIPILLSFAAGGFVYIAASDLMPELKKQVKVKKLLLNYGVFLIGITLMFLIKVIV